MTYLLHGLTLIFVLAKIFERIDWSWWLVFAPSMGAVVLQTLLLALAIYAVVFRV